MVDQSHRQAGVRSTMNLEQPALENRLPGVIAVVGCDGSGKSTLTADLLARLQDDYDTQLLYLGQDSGNIHRWIAGLPGIGNLMGRYLQHKSDSVHAVGAKMSSPGTPTALVIHGLSRWRCYKFRRMLALIRHGTIVITDRYPQAEVPGFQFDGSGLVQSVRMRGLVRWLAGREQRLYEQMADHVPVLLIRLNVDADTAYARKPDHSLAALREKARVIPHLKFNGAHIVDLDARDPYPQVLKAALAASRAAIAPQWRATRLN